MAIETARNEYAVFGLGNKQYEHYINTSRFMDTALQQCGAKRVAAIGLGDNDDNLGVILKLGRMMCFGRRIIKAIQRDERTGGHPNLR